jgi:1,4-dihydroxy-2-naphthoate octaprenyltransferase
MAATKGAGYARLLAFLRTRLLGAVLLPALIGGGAAYRIAAYRTDASTSFWLNLLLVLVGLACAELLNLFGTDYLHPRKEKPEPLLPGNPVISPDLLPPRRIPAVLIPLALAGLGILVYFAVRVDPLVTLFLAAALAIGLLYVLSPFPYAFLATALLPPILSGGACFAVFGAFVPAGFWAGLPIVWISTAVILTYQVLYRGAFSQTLALLMLILYLLAAVNILLFFLLAVYPATALIALLPVIALTLWVERLFRKEQRDAVPATAVGVLMHSTTSLLLALSLFTA